jgi:hypothetical protein
MTAESSGGFAGVLVSAPEKVALAEISSVLGGWQGRSVLHRPKTHHVKEAKK